MSSKESIIKTNSAIFSTKDAVVMGILNLTDDSFFDGGKHKNNEDIISNCKTMLDEGATIIDVGAQSSRPGASQISSIEELCFFPFLFCRFIAFNPLLKCDLFGIHYLLYFSFN